ncbi:MAG: LysR family transcriptional regulator [Rhodomicrobiaceae bacterium]
MLLTIRQLEILVAAADAPTFSEAAAAVGVSQPSLSETIRRAEAELGVQLFDRTTRSVTLTNTGRHSVAIAREMVRDFHRGLENIALGAERKRGRLTIAGLPSVACAILPSAIRRFHQAFPGIEVNVHDLLHERAVADVENGVADLALTIRPARLGSCLFEELSTDVLHFVCAPDHPLAKKRKVTWSDLAPYPFIALSRTSSVRRMTDAAFVNCDVFVEPAYELEQIPSAAALVEAGLGVSALPELTLAMIRGANVVAKPLGHPVMQRRIGVITLADRTVSDHVDQMLGEIRKTFQEFGEGNMAGLARTGK